MSDFTDGIMAQVDAIVDQRCASKGQYTLGELAIKLESFDKEKLVILSNGHTPGPFDSYRGYYRFIAIEYSNDDITVEAFLKEVKEAIGKTYTGYKGGEFTMTKNTPVWVSNYGHSSGDGIVDVKEEDGSVVLVVARIEDEIDV